MRRFNSRDLFGVGLVLLGGLMLLENMNILKGATSLFWAVILLGASLYFFNQYTHNQQNGWWNIIPAMVLLGMGLQTVLPKALHFLEGSLFLGSLGVAFFIVYFGNNSRWWGIIPGGVMLTLATSQALNGRLPLEGGTVFFLGLGITFLLVAILPSGGKKNDWGFIPALILLALAGLMMVQMNMRLLNSYLPYILIAAGVVMLARFAIGRKS